jgi:hypothetical protein
VLCVCKRLLKARGGWRKMITSSGYWVPVPLYPTGGSPSIARRILTTKTTTTRVVPGASIQPGVGQASTQCASSNILDVAEKCRFFERGLVISWVVPVHPTAVAASFSGRGTFCDRVVLVLWIKRYISPGGSNRVWRVVFLLLCDCVETLKKKRRGHTHDCR